MKKKILTATSLLCFILMLILSTGCNQNSYKTEGNKSDSLKEAVNDQPNSSGEKTGMELKNVNIIFHSDLKYTVVIDYSDGIKTTSEVTLIANGNSFLIDYMKSEYIE